MQIFSKGIIFCYKSVAEDSTIRKLLKKFSGILFLIVAAGRLSATAGMGMQGLWTVLISLHVMEIDRYRVGAIKKLCGKEMVTCSI